MTYRLNNKVQKLVPYEPEVGDYDIRLDANESYIRLPRQIQSEINQALSEIDFRRYPDPLAVTCSKAFADLYNLKPEYITAGNGSDELISVILGGLFQKGDKLLVTKPDFSMYEFYAHVAELQASQYIKDEAYQINVQSLISQAKQEKCAGLILSNPCNPTSQGMSKAQVREIIEALPQSLIIIDEAYMDFWDQSVLDLVEKFDNLLVLKTCSKAFGGAAMRLGFAAAGIPITRVLRSIKSPYNVNSLTQAAGAVLLSHKQCLKKAASQIVASRDKLYEDLCCLKDEPYVHRLGLQQILRPRTNFILVKLKNPRVIYEMLKQQGILVRLFPDFLRITTGSPAENQALITALKGYGEADI